jgi:hypothetical protein
MLLGCVSNMQIQSFMFFLSQRTIYVLKIDQKMSVLLFVEVFYEILGGYLIISKKNFLKLKKILAKSLRKQKQ